MGQAMSLSFFFAATLHNQAGNSIATIAKDSRKLPI